MIPRLILPKLNTTPLVLKLPQVGYANISVEIIDNRLSIASSFRNIWLDFVVSIDGELKLGKGHYKLAQKATALIMAGELLIDDEGLIAKINNNSGHYRPTAPSFHAFIDELHKNHPFLHSYVKIEVIDW